ncbi:hypothetical protein [Streptomyces sp. NPDC053048]|uniref:hypothetical protein n=1 Tax=Streptomyces sp. NPDC053048 TaxID=3365694 RepID=UPI0037D4A9A8
MKIRRIRTAVVSGFVIAVLTGTSGCGGGQGEKDSASGADSSPTAGSATSAADDAREAMKDVEVAECGYVEKQGITAKLSVINNNPTTTYSYDVTVKLTAPEGTPLATKSASFPFVRPGRMDTGDVTAPYTAKSGTSTSAAKCEVVKVARTTG